MATEDKELRAVPLREFNNWLVENKHYTWNLGKGGAFSQEGRDKGGTPFFKYFYLSLDTRDMKVFHIGTDHKSADFREALDGAENILDLLTYQIQERAASPAAPEGSLERDLQSNFPDLDYPQVVAALKFIKDKSVEALFSRADKEDGREFKWKKKRFTYHDMRDEFDKIVDAL